LVLEPPGEKTRRRRFHHGRLRYCMRLWGHKWFDLPICTTNRV
jgi:hypothetical protein